MSDATLRRVDAIRRFAEGDADDERIGELILAWLSRAVDDKGSLERALGLGVGWRGECQRAARDVALVRLWRTWFPGTFGREAARQVGVACRRYQSSRWTHDVRAKRRPDGLNGAVADVLRHGPTPSDRILQSLFKALPAQQSDDVSAQLIRQSA
jgi:hypothetical protein